MKTKPSSANTSARQPQAQPKLRWLCSLALGLLAGAATHVHGGTLYSARFDTGNDGFTNVASGSFSNLWHRSSIRSASPGFSQYYGREATTNYDTGVRNAGNLQSPPISLAGAYPPVKLSFSYSLLTEGNGSYDQAVVSVSADGGTNWATLASSVNSTLIQGSNFVTWTGDLSGYAGSNILVRFGFDTIDSSFNAFQGWFVDDVVIEGTLAAAYLRSTNGLPWGGFAPPDNEFAMTKVFGTNWSDLRFETVNPAALFSGATRFIFMDGSDANADELNTFLANNRAAISNWVAAGGSLFLNAAPNEGGNIDFGFGVTLVYPSYSSTVLAATPAHPIFNGPFTPAATSSSGASFGHGAVTGTGLTALLTNTANGLSVLAEKPYRFGHLIAGGMTLPYFHSPQPQSSNLLFNIIAYGAALGRTPGKPQVAVFDNPLYVDTTGTTSAESDTLQASLTNRGFAVVTFTNIVEAAAANNVLLIPEQENGSLGPALTATERSALSNFVVRGGSLIIHGTYLGPASSLINSVLGLSVVETYSPLTSARTAAANGTQFADDTNSLPAPSATTALQKTSLPPGSRSIYETNGLSYVAEMYVGAGKVIFLGWDWFDAAPLGSFNGGWLQVLESAVLERSLTPFYDDFEPNTDLGQWSEFGGVPGTTVLATNFGGSVSGANSLWFGATGSRFAASRSLNTVSGGTVDFWIRLGNSANPWDSPELPAEGVALEYSTDSGDNWMEMGRYDTVAYQTWTHVITDIPLVAQTINTRFRWRQLANSLSAFDHWALDNVGVFGPRAPILVTQPVNATVAYNGSPIFNVSAIGTEPLYYFWRRDGSVIPGANGSSYTTNNVQLADNGAQFSCIVSNAAGTVTTSNATLTVTALGMVAIPAATDSGISGSSESNALRASLTSLGFNVQVITQGQWTADSIVVTYPGCDPVGFGPSATDIANGVRHVKISDWGANWTSTLANSVTEGTNIAVVLGVAHPITSGLPTSWTAKGFWRYGFTFEDYVGYSADTTLPSLLSVTNPANYSRVLVAKTIGTGRAVYIGWNVYGPDAGPNDLAVLRNALLWSATTVTPPAITSQYDAGLNSLTLSWPETGFRLQSQTNSLAVGLSNNWVNFPGGTTSPVIITPNPTNRAVFFRLVSP